MTHAELVLRAAAWLRSDRSNLVVITEMATENRETPDAIGFGRQGTTLVECKTSRADFRRDRHKVCWRGDYPRMGHERFYLCADYVIEAEDLPEGWGLLWVGGPRARARVIRTSRHWECNILARDAEIRMLLSAFRRLGPEPVTGISVRHYLWPTKCRASLGTRAQTRLEVRP